MGIYRSDITDLKKSIEDNIGQKVIIKESPGKRSKPTEKLATIENVYKDYFRVKFDEVERNGSYNYTDLFTRTIDVKIFNEENANFEPLMQPMYDIKKHKISAPITPVETSFE